MAYTKQTWTDDVSAVTGARMTHIEQGIYDNSLATDKIKPSGTATTTAEIEEGQITDVIGFKSLKLKGQTSQYTTTGKNKLPYPYFQGSKTTGGITYTDLGDGRIKINGTATAYSHISILGTDKAQIDIPGNYIYGGANENIGIQVTHNEDGTYTTIGRSTGSSAQINKATYTTGYVEIFVKNGVTVNDVIITPMLTEAQDNNYEPYTGGKASPNPDFPQDVNNVSGDNVVRISNKNLYDKDDSNLIMNNVYINATGFVLTASNNMKTICMPCRANTTYTVSKTLSSRFIIGTASSNTIGTSMTAGRTNPSGTQVSVTSGANDKYLFVFYYHGSADTKTEQEIRNSIQVEIGSTATTYTAHQGNNFELNFTKNLFDSEKYLENASISNNTIVSSNNNNIFYIPVQYGRNYTISFVDNGVSGNILYGFSNDKPVIGGACTYNLLDITQLNKHTFTPVSANNKYLCIRLNVVNTNQYLAMENIQVEVGNQATEYIAYNENPIELCKISTYQDYIFKKDGKWWKHNEIGRKTLNGTETWTKGSDTSSNYYIIQNAITSTGNYADGLSDYFINAKAYPSGSTGKFAIRDSGTSLMFNSSETSVENWKTWLTTHNTSIYYPLATPIDEEITYTPLIRQLDELYNSGLYDVTNISQDNSSEAFVLDIEACKNNINGIVEYIRR